MLYEEIIYPGENVKLRVFCNPPHPELPKMNKRPGVVICPGGGYAFCSEREADIVAEQFLAAGFQAFVFTYSVGKDAEFPRPLVELSRAMRDIRANAEKYNLDPEKIAVGGFSAGGHLTASLGTLWNDPEVVEKSGCKNGENKPNFLILGYPVTTTTWMTLDEGENGLDRICGTRDRAEVLKKIEVSRNVGPHTPPAFIFHSFNDNLVPVEDSLIFAAAMADKNIPFDLHIFTNGYHGMSIAQHTVDYYDSDFSKWTGLCIDWLKRQCEIDGTQPKTPYTDRFRVKDEYKKTPLY